MIVVFDPLTNDFSGNGKAVLMPTSGKVKMVAGGDYSFTMEHPIDPWGKWRSLKEEAIVRLPVPEEIIENSFSGVEADVYKTNQDAELRDDMSEPETITYQTWSITANYSVGDKVTFFGRNFQCTYWDDADYLHKHQAPTSSKTDKWWKEIARKTNGATVLVTLTNGSELYFVEDVDGTWYKMSTYYGVQGYIKKSKLTYDHHSSQTENEPRTIKEQLFRIREVSVDRDNGKVSVKGKHVSYDLNGDLVEDMTVSQASAALAISRIMENLSFEYRGTIATNISADQDTTFSGTFKMKSGMHCLIDPDAGVVPTFNAKFTRDNWDLFVMENTETDRGLHIRYGANVNGITWTRKTDSLVTRVIPKAKAEDGSDLFLPERWVDSTHILEYQVIYMESLSVSGQIGKDDGTNTDTTWTEEALLDEMRQKALDRFEVDKADVPVTEITVQFEPLERSEEYKHLRGLRTVNLYDTVHVEDPDIGLEAEVQVSEIEFDIIQKKISGLKLSNVQSSVTRTVTGYNITNGSIGSEKLKDDVLNNTLDTAADNSAAIVEDIDVPIVDALDSTSTTAALSANQGKVLNDKFGGAQMLLVIGSANSSKTVNLGNGFRGSMLICGVNADAHGFCSIYATSGGDVTVRQECGSLTQLAFNTATRNKLTITFTSAARIIFVYSGEASIAT